MDGWKRSMALVPAASLVLALGVVRLPWIALAPGPARDVFPLIKIEGVETHPPEGRLLLTTVLTSRVSAITAVRGWLDSAIEVVHEDLLIPPGQTEEEFEQISLSQMDESKIAAAVIALRRLTDYPDDHGPGALVQDVVEGSAADGRLFPGDLIVSADGEELPDVDSLAEAIEGTEGRRRLDLVVRVGGEERRVTVAPSIPPGEDEPLLGVALVENFPFDLSIESGDIGGPSAGLMWALGIWELLTPRDLIAGHDVAGTGQVGLDGTVHPIGGVDEKVRAAERAGADVFLVPRGNLAAARAVADEIRLIPVETVRQAVRALRRIGDGAS